MRDQPFKKHFPIEKTKAQENYKYPTYQHYYRTKDLRNQDQAHPNRMQVNTEKNIKNEQQAPHTPTLLSKKTTKSSLKAQLENLKVEVQRIMQRKQGILKSPIEKKLFPAMERNKSDSHFAISPSKPREEEVEEQSVSSQTLLEEPLKKLELKAATENYDHNKYMELENELLKTELKNLKNKYISKKQQLKEKCQALEKKVVFLQSSLFNSEKSMAAEIQTLKQNIKAVEKERQTQLIPTSDKARQLSPTKAEPQSDVVKQKIKKLYDQLSKKNKLLLEKQQAVENLTNELTKVKKDCSLKQERMATLSDEVQELKKTKNTQMMLLSDKDTRIQQLLDELEQERSRQYETNKDQNNDQIQDKIDQLRVEYEEKIRSLKEEFERKYEQSKVAIDQKVILEEELKFLQSQNQEKQTKIQQLNEKVKEALSDCHSIEEKYMKMLEKTEKKHEEALNNLHLEYQSKIANLSTRREKSLRDFSASEKGSKQRVIKQGNEGSPVKEHEVRKWKLQYKQLKEKYEQHVKAQTNKKQEIKEYYKNYRDYKQKAQIYSHKLKLFEKEFEKYLSILTAKENQLLKKQIELRKLTSDWNLEKNTYEQQVCSLTQKYKTLQEKYNEEAQRFETETVYRKQIEEKVFLTEVTDDALKEVMERMKKRLIEQDQKYTKYLKDLKNKEVLNSKLKQELREVMENMEKKVNQQKVKEISEIIEKHIEKEFDSFKEWKKIAEADKKIMTQSHDKLTAEIESLKATIFQKEEAVASLQDELNNFAHSYNLKNIEMNQLLDEREFMIRRFNEDIEEINIIKGTVENILHEELARKNEEITSLRMQIAAQSIRPLEYKSFHASFDDILKSHIEDNKKLRDDITKKTEQIFKLRDNYGSLRSQYQNLKAQIEINKLKALSEMKNMQVNYQVQTDKIKNELDMAEKKVNLLEQKFKLVIQENKKKDTFIQTYIVGKKLTQSDKDLVTNFIKQYQITVGSSDIAHRLANQTQEIEKLTNYNRLLLKEISHLKEKLMQYEAIDEEKVSIYDSKLSKYSFNSGDANEQPYQEIQAKPVKEKSSLPSESRLKKAQSMQIFTQIQHQI